MDDEFVIKKGTMEKSPLKMSKEELAEWKKKMAVETRAYLFSIGQPLVNRINGKIVVQYPNGKIETA